MVYLDRCWLRDEFVMLIALVVVLLLLMMTMMVMTLSTTRRRRKLEKFFLSLFVLLRTKHVLLFMMCDFIPIQDKLSLSEILW